MSLVALSGCAARSAAVS